MSMKLGLEILPERFTVCLLGPGAPIPDWAQGVFVSMTRTSEELSIVCCEDKVPDGVRREGSWRCLRLVGQFDLAEIGILAALTKALAEAEVGVLAVGTFYTDYLLVAEANLPDAIQALERAGHSVQRRVL